MITRYIFVFVHKTLLKHETRNNVTIEQDNVIPQLLINIHESMLCTESTWLGSKRGSRTGTPLLHMNCMTAEPAATGSEIVIFYDAS